MVQVRASPCAEVGAAPAIGATGRGRRAAGGRLATGGATRGRTVVALAGAALLAAAAPACVAAEANPDGPPNGLIAGVTADKVRYAPGEVPSVTFTLGPQRSAFAGRLDWVACDRTVELARGSAGGIGIEAGGSASRIVAVAGLPRDDFRGYMVFAAPYADGTDGTVGCLGNTGSPLGFAARGIDVSSDWTRFPRPGWVSDFTAGADQERAATGLARFGINYAIFYDVDCKAHLPYCPGPSWKNLEGEEVSAGSVAAAIAAVHARGMATGLFADVALADADYRTDGSGTLLSSGLFEGTGAAPFCGAPGLPACMEARQAGHGRFPPGWRTPRLLLMDPADEAWRRHFLGNLKEAFRAYPYDAFQADTLGAPPNPVFDAGGRRADPGAALAHFAAVARAALGRPVIVNSVSLWAARDLALRGGQPFFFAEVHPEFGDHPTFAGPAGMASLLRRWTSARIAMPAYVNKGFAASRYACAPPPAAYRQPFISTLSANPGCYVNTPGAQLAGWAFLAAGIQHVVLGDWDPNCGAPKYATGEFWKGPMPCMRPALQSWLGALSQIQMGYLNLFYEGVTTAPERVMVTSGGVASTDGRAGTVMAQARTKAGFAFWDFTNLASVDTANSRTGLALYQDKDGTMPEPRPISITAKAYHFGAIADGAPLYAISPDWQGQPRLVPYARGHDAGGDFVTAELPAFSTGLRLVLETRGLAGGGPAGAGYDLEATEPLRGGHYTDATPGCGTPPGSAAAAGSGGCHARYPGLRFGRSGLRNLVLKACATAPSTGSGAADAALEVRLDSPGGLLVGSARPGAGPEACAKPREMRLSSPTAGRHDVYFRFVAGTSTVEEFAFR